LILSRQRADLGVREIPEFFLVLHWQDVDLSIGCEHSKGTILVLKHDVSGGRVIKSLQAYLVISFADHRNSLGIVKKPVDEVGQEAMILDGWDVLQSRSRGSLPEIEGNQPKGRPKECILHDEIHCLMKEGWGEVKKKTRNKDEKKSGKKRGEEGSKLRAGKSIKIVRLRNPDNY
jgi:hypothetical protein